MSEREPKMNLVSECKLCGAWIPDPEGNSYWSHEPLEKHVTYTICDNCKVDERMFKLVSTYATEGIVYDHPYDERFVDHCVHELIKKFGPKGDKRYVCLSIYWKEAWLGDHVFRIEDNFPHWYAR